MVASIICGDAVVGADFEVFGSRSSPIREGTPEGDSDEVGKQRSAERSMSLVRWASMSLVWAYVQMWSIHLWFGRLSKKFVPIDTCGMHFHSTFRLPVPGSGLTSISGALFEAGERGAS